jgi:DNA-binding IclR family transcriptional regulator
MVVLELFTGRESEWGLTELAERTGISKSMAHRLLSTMADRGFINQNPRTRRYRLGLRLLGLGAVVGDSLRIRRVALPHMEAMARELGEAVFLTVPDQGSAVAVARVETNPGINWLLGIGERSPLTAGASNKILLAFLPAPEGEAVLARAAADGSADEQALRAELEQIRRQGWAFSVGEVTRHTAAVAVPILGQESELFGGLSVAGPAARFTAERTAGLVVKAQEAALAIARHYLYSDTNG